MISHLNLPLIERPSFTDKLKFPDCIADLASFNVSDLLGKYTQLHAYVTLDLANLNQSLLKLEAQERERKNEILQENPRINTIEKHKREAFYETDAKMRNLFIQRIHLNMRKEHTIAFQSIYDRFITALSRELSRKSSVEDKGTRFSR